MVKATRTRILDRLAITENGILFRYVPAGSFLMGSEHGDRDEQPVHVVQLEAFWISDTPVSWAAYCAMMNWEPPPSGYPPEMKTLEPNEAFKRYPGLYASNKIRLQYCEEYTTHACDWHAHVVGQPWQSVKGTQTSQDLFGTPPRSRADEPWTYDQKPMVAVSGNDAEGLAKHLSSANVRYSLPTEAQWEKAARGGVIGTKYPWGNESATGERCDCDRFQEFSIHRMKEFAPNGYGVYAMSGGVWEWTADAYDAEFYMHSD